MKYIICQHDNAADMQREVGEFMAEGWRLSGSLVSHNGFLHQAMWHD